MSEMESYLLNLITNDRDPNYEIYNFLKSTYVKNNQYFKYYKLAELTNTLASYCDYFHKLDRSVLYNKKDYDSVSYLLDHMDDEMSESNSNGDDTVEDVYPESNYYH